MTGHSWASGCARMSHKILSILFRQVVYGNSADNAHHHKTGDNAPIAPHVGGGNAMVSPYVCSPLGLGALLWLVVLVHLTRPKRPVTAPAAPTQAPKPLTPTPPRAQAPQPCEGLPR